MFDHTWPRTKCAVYTLQSTHERGCVRCKCFHFDLTASQHDIAEYVDKTLMLNLGDHGCTTRLDSLVIRVILNRHDTANMSGFCNVRGWLAPTNSRARLCVTQVSPLWFGGTTSRHCWICRQNTNVQSGRAWCFWLETVPLRRFASPRSISYAQVCCTSTAMDLGDDQWSELPFDVRIAMEERAVEDALALQNPGVTEDDIKYANAMQQPSGVDPREDVVFAASDAGVPLGNPTGRKRLDGKQPCAMYPKPVIRPVSRLANRVSPC